MTNVIRTVRQIVVAPSGRGTQGPPGPAGSGSSIGVKDDGSTVSGVVERIDFAGLGASVSGSGADVAVTIPGTGGFVFFTPQMYGAVADGVTDDSSAFVAALAALKAFALNTGGGGFYKGSPRLFIPAGHYYLGTTPLDINHTVIIEGDGSGQFGPAGGGCSRLRWAAGTSGLRIQSFRTSGDTTVDGADHDAAGGVVLRDLCLEGGYAGTEGNYHGLIIRSAVKAERLYIKNWQGEGVKCWAGTVVSAGSTNYAGNVSTTLLESVKAEGNRGGIDIRGSDANVITTINCDLYQNRQFGLLDENGAGSNTHIGNHEASSGLISGAIPTQCTYSGNHYAAKWGGTFTNPPSGTTADTADWIYIAAGSVDAVRPAHTTTPSTFRAGGAYVTLGSASGLFHNCYSENEAFSQFTASTRISEGSIGDQYFRGGNRENSVSSWGWQSFQSPNALFTLRHRSTQGGFQVADEDGVVHSFIYMSKTGGNQHKARDANGHQFYTAPYNGSLTLRGEITTSGMNVPASHGYYVNGTQVVGARGAAVADATDAASAITQLNALLARLRTHGLITP